MSIIKEKATIFDSMKRRVVVLMLTGNSLLVEDEVQIFQSSSSFDA
jgi:hypothetical protein